MNNLNLSQISVREIEERTAQKINGGLSWTKIVGGWIAVVASEVVDVITSDGENLEEAYQNGKEFGEYLME